MSSPSSPVFRDQDATHAAHFDNRGDGGKEGLSGRVGETEGGKRLGGGKEDGGDRSGGG